MKFAIFDIDGTLTDTTSVDDKSYFQAFAKTFDKDISSTDWDKITHVTDWGIAEELIDLHLNRRAESSDYDNLKKDLLYFLKLERDNDINQFQSITGSNSFVNELMASSDFEIGIATGAWKESARIKLEASIIDIDSVCSATSSDCKSRVDILKKVIQDMSTELGHAPEHIVYFGDGTWDYHTCRELDIDFIGIDFHQNQKLKSLGAPYVFQDFQDAKSIQSAMEALLLQNRH